jgi:hypothetical protein
MNSFCLFATINIEGRESNTSQQKKDNNINIKSHNYNKTSGYNIKTALIKRERESYNTTFNNISAISWRSVLLVEETGVPGENH